MIQHDGFAVNAKRAAKDNLTGIGCRHRGPFHRSQINPHVDLVIDHKAVVTVFPVIGKPGPASRSRQP